VNKGVFVNIENALKIQGWMRDTALEYLATVASHSRRVAEIGSWKGRSTVAMAENTEGTVYAIDTWLGSDEVHQVELAQHPDGWLFEEFSKNVSHLKNVIPCKMTSQDAAKHFLESGERFDFIFIDASHDYENVHADILAWRQLLTHDGVITTQNGHRGLFERLMN
jgi:predicted O-methyltransferase YrrM